MLVQAYAILVSNMTQFLGKAAFELFATLDTGNKGTPELQVSLTMSPLCSLLKSPLDFSQDLPLASRPSLPATLISSLVCVHQNAKSLVPV